MIIGRFDRAHPTNSSSNRKLVGGCESYGQASIVYSEKTDTGPAPCRALKYPDSLQASGSDQ